MLFTQVERGHTNLAQYPGQAFLVKDRWNDYGYVTMFQLLIVDDTGTWHDLGNVKIGGFGVPEGWTAWPDLPARFQALDDQFFSLGQDDTYYEKLAGLGADVRVEVLTALRDLAFDPALLRRAEDLDVTTTSLLRGIPVGVVENQFRRIAHGGARVTPYEFQYQLADDSFLHGPRAIPRLEFTVTPDRQPPTNIHVVIGRNAVGKSHLLRNLVRAVADRRAEPSAHGQIFEHGTASGHTFRGVVAVSFSAFDEFVSIPQAHQAVPYIHIGPLAGRRWPHSAARPGATGRHVLRQPGIMPDGPGCRTVD